MNNKIPVFYHIPKNAGTYVSDWIIIAFRYYWNVLIINPQKYKNPNKDFSDLRNSIKCLQILKNNVIIAKLFVENPFYFCESYSKFKTKHSIFEWQLDIEDITKELLTNINLFGIIIESQGFKCRNDIFDFFPDLHLYQFLILRDSFSRAQSFYKYITSESSVHERTHGLIKSDTFEDHVISNQLEDSWLIRNIANVEDSMQINETHYNQTINFLKSFNVYNIKRTDEAIQETFSVCYGFDTQKIKLNPWDKVNKNETNYKKINIEELSKQAQDVFKQRTYWDQKLYEHFFK